MPGKKDNTVPRRKKTDIPFAKNLQKVLKERGLSQRAAAEIAGVSVTTINDWLSGTSPANLEAVLKLCRALKTEFQWMLTGTRDSVDTKDLTLSEIFDIQDDPAFSGIFKIEAKRLKRRNEREEQ